MKRLLPALLILIVVSASAWSQPPKTLYCPEPNWDWGSVGIDFDLSHTYLLINGTSSTISVDSVIAPCDCSLARPSDSTLEPGDTARVVLKFSTRDFYGRTTKQVDIYWRDSAPHYLQLTYSATVGQYAGGLKPDPVYVFLVPGQSSKKLSIPVIKNELFTQAEIVGEVVQQHEHVDVTFTNSKARVGEKLELEVSAKPDLKPGTYVSNFRFSVRVVVKGQPQTVLITIPTKIVRY